MCMYVFPVISLATLNMLLDIILFGQWSQIQFSLPVSVVRFRILLQTRHICQWFVWILLPMNSGGFNLLNSWKVKCHFVFADAAVHSLEVCVNIHYWNPPISCDRFLDGSDEDTSGCCNNLIAECLINACIDPEVVGILPMKPYVLCYLWSWSWQDQMSGNYYRVSWSYEFDPGLGEVVENT